MKDIDLAYVAGILDGEGCISITKIRPKNTNLHNPCYGLQIRVSMVDKAIPLLCQSFFGGYLWQKPPRNEKEKPQWKWAVQSKEAVKCLNLLLPYLRSKKNEAELAIKFWEIKRHRGGNKGLQGNLPKSKEELVLEESHYVLMRKLKNKSEVMING